MFSRSGGVWTQQGSKLVGSGVAGETWQGWSVALSADGSTAIVGGPFDNNSAGAAWVFTRSDGVWTQQGSKLVGSGAAGAPWAEQGFSVALSGDGNTAIVGGPKDNNDAGAAWVFTRAGGVWNQQGSKLVGSGAVMNALQGWSVALSADGNTALVGGSYDNGGDGATWVFTRNGGVWTQQGTKLVGSGAAVFWTARQGYSVVLSADGNTAIVGGPYDSGYAGGVWVFTRSGGIWTQQGSKLVGSGAADGSPVFQGASVSLSGDGNTAIVGGDNDNDGVGAIWVFTRSGGVWTQQGSKLVGSGAAGNADQGSSVALSADGITAIVGGPGDNASAGAAWVFTQPSFFTGEIYFGSSQDLYYLQFANGTFFGLYGRLPDSWIYHLDLGYEYIVPANDAANSVYMGDSASGHWWYTNPSLFPFLYDFTRNAWLWYSPADSPGGYTSNPRYFYDFTAQAWITL